MQDADGTGFLKEIDLENFIFNVIPELPALKGLQESFHPFYVFHAVRKFMFFLPCNNGTHAHTLDTPERLTSSSSHG